VQAILPSKAGEQPTVPRYEIVGELGRGGMGVVYKARQRGLNRWVALKMVLAGAHASPQQLARFNTEAEAVARLQHPNIVQIYDVGELDGLPYFSLEYIDGASLDQQIHRQPQPPRMAANLIETLARAMHYAHENGIIHRDLKPANVLMTSDGKPKITDFGLAKRLEEDSGQTKSGTLMGTPSYMAPEQARGEIKNVGPLADVYSLGAMFYELLTGRPPFLASTAMDTIMQVTRDEAMAPTRLRPDTPPDLETICMKCLQKEPEKRYQSALALAEDLERFQVGEPILARPVSGLERLWRWCRRNPRVAALTGAVAALLVSVSVVSVASAVRISNEQQATLRQKEEADRQRKEALAQRDRADKARERADANAKVADQMSKLSQNTLLKLVTTVQAQLQNRPDMEDLKENILNDALSGLEVVAKTAESSPLAARTRGGVYQRKGDMFLTAGKTKEALEAYQQGLAQFQKGLDDLAADEPQCEIAQYNVAVLNAKMGDVSLQRGSVSDARKYHQEAWRMRKSLAEGTLKSPEFKDPAVAWGALASSYNSLGNLALQEGDIKLARDNFREGHQVREKLVRGPEDLQGRHALASSYNGLAELSYRLDDKEGTRRYFADLLKLMQDLIKADPKNVGYKKDMATTLERRGDINLFWRQELDKTLEYYEQGSRLRQAMLDREPSSAELKIGVATAKYRLGTVNLFLGRLDPAHKYYEQSLKMREKLAADDPANTQRKYELMLALARCGQHQRAAELAGAIHKATARDPTFLFCVACGYALCIPAVLDGKDKNLPTTADLDLQKRYADKSIEALRQAIAKGYDDRVTLETDPDLAPLQNDPRFKELLKQMGKH
jgi:serine/threonine protein kinase